MSTAAPSRILSIDQFRGYTVAGMFVVNFCGSLTAIHPILKHHNIYFSYADTIMPSFIFLVGFSYRLTFLRRLEKYPPLSVYLSFVKRSLALVLLSLMVFGFGNALGNWQQVSQEGAAKFVLKIIKADLWEVLAIIGVCQIFIMPVIAASSRVRLLALVGCAILHVLISYSFNYDFVNGRPNWMDTYVFGLERKTAWDGGCFGIISWSIAMLAGTLAYDILSTKSSRHAASQLFAWGAGLMLFAYALSCLSTLYNVEPDPEGTPNKERFAESPVIPPFSKMKTMKAQDMLAKPPFVPPPPVSERKHSYWMMDKRAVSVPFILFGAGFALAGTAIFVVFCDIWGLQIGVFRTLGTNALAAYVIHHMVEHSILAAVPKDAALWFTLIEIAVFFGISYMFVRHLEKHNLYLRL